MAWLASQPLLASFTSESHLALELPSEMCWRDSKACTRLTKSFQKQQQHSSPPQGPARLEGWANSNLGKFKEDQCKLLDLRRKNPARVKAGGGWAGENLCGSCWCPGASWAIQERADTRHGPSMHLGIGLTPSTLHSWDCGQIQCLVLGLPQYTTWTSWCMLSEGPPGWSGLEQFPVRMGWGMGCLSLGKRWLQRGWRRVAQFPHSNGTMLILLLCTPFLIKLHTKGCVIYQSLILTVLERRGLFTWMERQNISLPPGKWKSTAWGARGATVPYLNPWLLKLPHDGNLISTLHL